MKLNEFMNTNQNQWKNIFTRNENFRVELYGRNGHLKTLKANYTDDLEYLTIYKDMKIAYWETREKDLYVIELEY